MVNPDTFLLDRVAQPFADRFLRDDQAQRVAAFLLPGTLVALVAFYLARPAPVNGFAGVGLLAMGWLVWRWTAALRAVSHRDGFANPLRARWRWHRYVWLPLLALGVTSLAVVGSQPHRWIAVGHHVLVLTALYLGSTDRPSGLHQTRQVQAGASA